MSLSRLPRAWCFLFVGLAALSAAASSRADAPGDETQDGFAPLFDGKTLAGWVVMNGGKFTAQEGAIKLEGGGGWLRSEQEFDDFILRFEVRWLKPKQDSGIFLRAGKEGKNWPDRKYEVQCENTGRLATIFGAKHERDAAHCEKLLKAPGEWQTFEITCEGANCEVRFNGELASKSSSLKPGSGHLGIQGENGQLEFRNLRLKKLAAAPKEAANCDAAAEPKKEEPKKDETKKPDDKKPDDKKPEDKKSEDKKPEKPKEIAPPIVDPGVTGTPDQPGRAPADAIVLFDGTNFDQWQGDGKPGDPIKWKLLDDQRAMEIAKGSGGLRTKESFGFGHYHLEFRTPAEVKGSGQGRGNSGIYTLGGPEVQVLDSYNNETYFNGQCGSIYGFYAPLVNACRPPGVWQTYDILYHPPVLGDDGKALRPATMTVLHNGVVIHANAEIKGMNDPKRKGPINLQDHGNPVGYRNIWHRPFVRKEEPAADKKPDDKKPDDKSPEKKAA